MTSSQGGKTSTAAVIADMRRKKYSTDLQSDDRRQTSDAGRSSMAAN